MAEAEVSRGLCFLPMPMILELVTPRFQALHSTNRATALQRSFVSKYKCTFLNILHVTEKPVLSPTSKIPACHVLRQDHWN